MTTPVVSKEAEIRLGHCPTCKRNQKCDVLAHENRHSTSSEDDMWRDDDYYILECRGCSAVFFQQVFLFSEDLYAEGTRDEAEFVSNWPPERNRHEPEWLNDLLESKTRPIWRRLRDVYGALNAGLGVPAAAAMRTVFDIAAVLLGADPEASFEKKLNKLVDLGELASGDRKSLELLVDAGSASIHRGWEPDPAELNLLCTILESFVQRRFVFEKHTAKLDQSVPKKAPKKSSKKSSKKT